jgi:hypothetical protein
MLLMWFQARVNQLGELVIPQTSSLRRGTLYPPCTLSALHFSAWDGAHEV